MIRPRALGVAVRFRWRWTLRLLMLDLRRHRGARGLGVGAFALAAAAALGCVLCAGALRDLDPSRTGDVAAELVAFLRDDVPDGTRARLASVLERLPGVAAVRQLSGGQALARMRWELGARAPVLDGVEEGFLPATLEVSLRRGESGVERADAIAWRLRRMEGVAAVDVLRTTADERLLQAGLRGHRLGQIGFAAAAVTLLLALMGAALANRLGRGDRVLLSGLGFTAAGVAWPVALAAALCGGVGAALGVAVSAGVAHVVTRLGGTAAPWWAALPWRSLGGGAPWWAAGGAGLSMALLVGGGLGWWGARPHRREVEELGRGD